MDENTTRHIISALVVGATAAGTKWLLSSRRPDVPRLDGTSRIYGVHRAHRLLAASTPGFFGILLVYGGLLQLKGWEWMIPAVIITGFLGACFGIGSVVIDDQKVRMRRPSGVVELAWGDISAIFVDEARRTILIHSESRQRNIDIHSRIIAFEDLVRELARRSPVDIVYMQAPSDDDDERKKQGGYRK